MSQKNEEFYGEIPDEVKNRSGQYLDRVAETVKRIGHAHKPFLTMEMCQILSSLAPEVKKHLKYANNSDDNS